MLRQPFSQLIVHNYEQQVIALCSTLLDKLTLLADSSEAVAIDKLFGQLTVDVICQVAFQMDISALHDSAEFEVCKSVAFVLIND